MDSKVSYINRIVKGYDRKLFAKRVAERIIVYRKHYVGRSYDLDGSTLIALESAPQFVLALTHDWQFNGSPREWGWEPIRKRLKDMDYWENENFLDKLEAEEEKQSEEKQKDLKNSMEAFWSDQYSRVKKSWGDINTSCMSKNIKRRF